MSVSQQNPGYAEYTDVLSNWEREQLSLKKKVIEEDSSVLCKEGDNFCSLSYIGGVDISFPKNDDLVHACASLVVTSYPANKVVYEKYKIMHLSAPYIPEYLAFREANVLADLVRECQDTDPTLSPQIVMVDGNGRLHPRGFGLACHLGVNLDMPTIGIAKKLFHVDGLKKDEEHKRKIAEQLRVGGNSFSLVGDAGVVLGKALRSTDKASNPVYVSIGHKVSLDTATELVLSCCKYRIPEPVRLADQGSREHLRENYEDHLENCNENWKELSDWHRRFSEISAERKIAKLNANSTMVNMTDSER